MSRAHAWLYRKTRGRLLGSIAGQPVLLLTTVGRRTGRPRTTPVEFCGELRARVAVGSERERLWAKLVTANPRLATIQDRARRQLPVVVLEPR
jgi:hypothetical protein